MIAAPRGDVVDIFHGTPVADPFRTLENPDAADTLAWVADQNERTVALLGSVQERESIRERLTQLFNYSRRSIPTKAGARYFFSRNSGLQNQAVLYRQDKLEGEAVVLLDPNSLSDDGTVALTLQSFSHDGSLLAYGTSRSGSDRQEIRIRDTQTGQDLADLVQWCKFASVAWKKDGSGFYYNRFPQPDTVSPEDESKFERVYWHTLGTQQADDAPVYDDPVHGEIGFRPIMSDDGEYLLLSASLGTDPRNGLAIRQVESSEPFYWLIETGEAVFEPIEVVGSTLYVHTDLEAPRGRVVAIPLGQPDRAHWRELIPEQSDAIAFSVIAGEYLVVTYMHDAHHRVQLFDLNGSFARELPLPVAGSVGSIWGKYGDQELFIGFASFLFPTTVFRYDLASQLLSAIDPPDVPFDTSGYLTDQVFATSSDGTRVPMFLTHRKDIQLDGTHPVLLTGYGGFNISITPTFSVTPLVWLEAGGVYAVANLRGGGEYGEQWHTAGMRELKQNVFNDFIACSEFLVEQGYTSSKQIAISGGSNGGLLVAATMLQRPDLVGAVVCQVPVIDMLRYHRFTVGRFWVPEYGNAESSAAEFEYLHAYSPLHNVQPGQVYPPILITSAESDDRVVPAHAKKFAATMQERASDQNPILLRVEAKAGHGAGKPLAKTIDEQVDIYSFLFKFLEIHLR